jgi:hypothetical protein
MSPERPAAPARRWWLWLPLLAAAAWLAVFGDKPADPVALSVPARREQTVQAAPRPIPTAASKIAAGARTEPIEALVSRDQWAAAAPAALEAVSAAAKRDLFSSRNWNPPQVVAVATAPPAAPPLPFAFLGKKLEGEVWEVYLARGDQTFIVREGSSVDGAYRVDKIAPPLVALTYLPLGQSQTLPIGESR